MDQFAWNAVRRLGHREEVRALAEPGLATAATAATGLRTTLGIPVGAPGPDVPSRPVLEIGSYDMSFGTPA
jgi:hypothetical protein